MFLSRITHFNVLYCPIFLSDFHFLFLNKQHVFAERFLEIVKAYLVSYKKMNSSKFSCLFIQELLYYKYFIIIYKTTGTYK